MNWLCIPGWATSPDIFDKIIPDNSNFNTVDLNFYNDSVFPEIDLSEYEGAICYSLGSLLAIRSKGFSTLKKIVFIGGFTNFPGVGSKDSKMRTMKIKLMIRGLKKDSLKIVNDFCDEAGLAKPHNSAMNVNNLIHGLELLRDCDMSHALCNTKAEIITIHGKDDVIVPEELNRLQFMNIEQKRYSLDGNHGIIQRNSLEIKKILSELV